VAHALACIGRDRTRIIWSFGCISSQVL
jgi:hypothetical protein